MTKKNKRMAYKPQKKVNLELEKPGLTQNDILDLTNDFPEKDWEIKIYGDRVLLSKTNSIGKNYIKTIESLPKMGYIVILKNL